MASQSQYDFFKAVYDEEIDRRVRLGNRANLYFTIISFFLGAIIFNYDSLDKFLSHFQISAVWYLVISALLALGLVFTVSAIVVRSYEGICDPVAIISGFGKTPQSDASFFDDRLIDFAIATKLNADQSGRVASLLKCSSYCLLTATIVQTLVLVAAIFDKLK